jgi:hypothetical protein
MTNPSQRNVCYPNITLKTNDLRSPPYATPTAKGMFAEDLLFITAAVTLFRYAGLSITAPIALFRSNRLMYHGVHCLLP